MALFLIADDSSFCRTMARMPLERAGHEVIEACDGEEALMLARLHDPEVVIAGTHLPAIDTIELVAKLRVEGFRPPDAAQILNAVRAAQERSAAA